MKIENLFILFIILCIAHSCTTELGSFCQEGDGQIEKRLVEFEPLTKLELGIEGTIFIEEGPQRIEIEAPSDIIDKILDESQIGSERWVVELDGCYDGPDITIWASLPKFQALDISGSGNIFTTDTLRNVSNLNLEIDGSGNIELTLLDAEKLDMEIKGSGNITTKALKVTEHSYDIQGSGNIISKFDSGQLCRTHIEGSGNVTAVGKVSESNIDLEGSGNVFMVDLCSENCDIDSKGEGNCEVKVSNQLDIKLEGSGNICYRGQPIVNTDLDGSGNISTCN